MQSISVIQAAICNSRAAFWDLYQVASACKVIKLPMCEEVTDLSDFGLVCVPQVGTAPGPWSALDVPPSPGLTKAVRASGRDGACGLLS